MISKAFNAIFEDGFKKSVTKVIKFPFNFSKLKVIIALLLPKFILMKIHLQITQV